MSIVSHLTGIPGYDWDRDQVLSDYVAEVDSVFAPYRNHRAVRFVAKKLLNKGFNWHFPMHVALSFDIENGHITARKGLVRDFDGYYERISHADEKRLLKLWKTSIKRVISIGTTASSVPAITARSRFIYAS